MSDPFAHTHNSISEVTRRAIVDELLLGRLRYHGDHDPIDFLGRVWNLKEIRSTDSRFADMAGDLWQHTVRNNDYDDADVLYSKLKILDVSDEVFGNFLATSIHPIVRRSDDDRIELLRMFNEHLEHDGFRLIADTTVSGYPVYRMIALGSDPGSHYEVVLSYASEERSYVGAVAEMLRSHGVSVFYDQYEEATLWGKDLVEHLDSVFSGNARFCILFSSANYGRKVWTSEERRSALERAINSRVEYILPVRFDDTELPGLRGTVGYIDGRTKSPSDVAELILQKLGRRR